ncbi:MAG: MaoC/PaaZ C-terminal domain-containing protein [Pseudomonadota bacterium]
MINTSASNGEPVVREWHELAVGMTVRIPFTISHEDMAAFEALSGDRSRIHKDAGFAKANGFAEPVVYGALTVARLSQLVGMHLPGDLGLATSWRIDFNNPLYVGEDAWFEGELMHVSEATRTVKIKFRVHAAAKQGSKSSSDDKLVATGSAESKILLEAIA